jgi:hypothetical protein
MLAENRRAMPDTAVILRPAAATPVPGGYDQTFQQVTTQVVTPAIQAMFPDIAPGTTPCRIKASILAGGNEVNGPGEEVATMAYTMTMPPGTDVRKQDRVQAQGKTFEVNAIKGAASWNLSDSATLTEIQ